MTILDPAEMQTAAEKQAALLPNGGKSAEPTAANAKHTATGNSKPPVSNSFLDKFFQISKRETLPFPSRKG